VKCVIRKLAHSTHTSQKFSCEKKEKNHHHHHDIKKKSKVVCAHDPPPPPQPKIPTPNNSKKF